MNYGWLTYPEINKCKEMYKNGRAIKDIAKELDRDEIYVQNLLETERVIVR
jgi:hypothetical protein